VRFCGTVLRGRRQAFAGGRGERTDIAERRSRSAPSETLFRKDCEMSPTKDRVTRHEELLGRWWTIRVKA
jgi:hypothetical protein